MTVVKNMETELLEMINEAIQIYKGEDSKDKFQPFAEKVINKIFKLNLFRIHSEFEDLLDLPKITLTLNRRISAMAYYSTLDKEVFLVSWNYEKCLLVEICKEQTVQQILDILKARMLFSIVHELGHHFYYIENGIKPKTSKEVKTSLLEITGVTSLLNIKNNVKAKDFILNEAYRIVDEEKLADDFAFSKIDLLFNYDFKVLEEIKEVDKRKKTYKNYASRTVSNLVTKFLNFLSLTERLDLVNHYKNLIKLN